MSENADNLAALASTACCTRLHSELTVREAIHERGREVEYHHQPSIETIRRYGVCISSGGCAVDKHRQIGCDKAAKVGRQSAFNTVEHNAISKPRDCSVEDMRNTSVAILACLLSSIAAINITEAVDIDNSEAMQRLGSAMNEKYGSVVRSGAIQITVGEPPDSSHALVQRILDATGVVGNYLQQRLIDPIKITYEPLTRRITLAYRNYAPLTFYSGMAVGEVYKELLREFTDDARRAGQARLLREIDELREAAAPRGSKDAYSRNSEKELLSLSGLTNFWKDLESSHKARKAVNIKWYGEHKRGMDESEYTGASLRQLSGTFEVSTNGSLWNAALADGSLWNAAMASDHRDKEKAATKTRNADGEPELQGPPGQSPNWNMGLGLAGALGVGGGLVAGIAGAALLHQKRKQRASIQQSPYPDMGVGLKALGVGGGLAGLAAGAALIHEKRKQ